MTDVNLHIHLWLSFGRYEPKKHDVIYIKDDIIDSINSPIAQLMPKHRLCKQKSLKQSMKTISNIFYEEDPETQKNMCNIGLIIEHEPNKNYGGTNYVVETVI